MSDALSVTLVPDQALLETLRADESSVVMVREFSIDSYETADLANDELRGIIARTKRLKEWQDKFVQPANQIISNAKALFNPALSALRESELMLRTELTRWTNLQQRMADDARRQAEKEERERRQRAEAEAAAARAQAAQEALEQHRLAEEAEKQRRAALAAGDAQRAAKAAADAAEAQERAHQVVANAEQQAVEGQLAAAAQNVAVVAPEKVAGFSLVANWGAELAEGFNETQAIVALARALAGVGINEQGGRFLTAERMDLVPLLKRDESACNKLGKALKSSMNVPGLRAVNKPSSRSTK